MHCDVLIATSSFQLASGLGVIFALPPRSSWYRWQSMPPRNPPIQKTRIHVNVWEYCHRHPSAYVACYISWARFLVWSHWSTPLDHQQCGTHTWDRLRDSCSHWCNWALRQKWPLTENQFLWDVPCFPSMGHIYILIWLSFCKSNVLLLNNLFHWNTCK